VIEASQNASETHLRVCDNGPGFDPAHREQLFTPFFSTKGVRGTGLGLTIAESLVRNAEGRIDATSVPGEGATFNVHLPNQGA
jgi:signal transduction histidine kinase